MDGWDWVTAISDRPTTIAPLKAVLTNRSIHICIKRQQLKDCLKQSRDGMAVSAHLRDCVGIAASR